MSDPANTFDVAVLGSGPGGYVAAIRGSQLGLRVALVEPYARFGGTCLHQGCVPTKALAEAARLYRQALKGKEYGVLCADLRFDLALARARKERLVKKLSAGIEFLLKKNRVETIQGRGRLGAPGVVEVRGEEGMREIRARHIVIATGSENKNLPGLEPDGRNIISHKEILELDRVPGSLLVVGAGSIGIEFASILSLFGSRVTVVEMLPRILPLEDPEISRELQKILTRQGIRFLTGARVERLEAWEEGVHAEIVDAEGKREKIEVDKALIAVGRSPSTRDLGLEQAGVETKEGFIPVDGDMRTNVAGIYAIGDVVPTPALAHLASHEGMAAVEAIARGRATPINYDLVPACTFCHPKVASVGLTEPEAARRGFDVVVGRFPFAAVSLATILGENSGFVKIVSEKGNGRILGVHMIGPHVTELISEGTAIIGLRGSAADVSALIHPHPTLSEGLMEAARALYAGAAIHI